MRHLSVRSDDANAEVEDPMHHPATQLVRGAPFVDHTGEPGFEEVDGEVDVYLAAEPSINGNRPEDLLWIVCWHVGAMATGVRVVRRAGGTVCDSSRDSASVGEALVNIMKTNEVLAGSDDLKLMHMYQHPLGKLDLGQRRALRCIAQQTSCRELPARSAAAFRTRLLSHREWMETVMQEAIEQDVFQHSKVTEAFSAVLSNDW
ncbi:hypothetical protein PHLGIDRAFT_161372 [Phlebiopsis gigantea 11061_1 CR5-6]|uniref:Uncharacterized protein n=1 Tax=Phlebiopsis gigantea (strain 11061_1 CR5-6) TaxID=745531 RepID=A0A0C3S4Z8_PHLG1|nr:hypothetical protein PHLGIDRAFT_161372 [Phlebiopsis gigantea 11061_1 CR5-6]